MNIFIARHLINKVLQECLVTYVGVAVLIAVLGPEGTAMCENKLSI